MHSFHPHFIPELCFLLVALYYFPHVLLFHRRSLMDLLLAIQLRILFNPGTCKVSSHTWLAVIENNRID